MEIKNFSSQLFWEKISKNEIEKNLEAMQVQKNIENLIKELDKHEDNIGVVMFKSALFAYNIFLNAMIATWQINTSLKFKAGDVVAEKDKALNLIDHDPIFLPLDYFVKNAIEIKAIDQNFDKKIDSEFELDKLLEENGYTKYVSLDYKRSDLEDKYPFFKKLWYKGISYYSYSADRINDYFGRKVVEKNTPMTAYVINVLINLHNKEKYWDSVNE